LPTDGSRTLKEYMSEDVVVVDDAARFRQVLCSFPTGSPAPVSRSPLVDGAVAHLHCDLEQQHLAGDHWIVVGRVRYLDLHRDTGHGFGGRAAAPGSTSTSSGPQSLVSTPSPMPAITTVRAAVVRELVDANGLSLTEGSPRLKISRQARRGCIKPPRGNPMRVPIEM
jgi:hypothetical protein